jgi:hypothetical protein
VLGVERLKLIDGEMVTYISNIFADVDMSDADLEETTIPLLEASLTKENEQSLRTLVKKIIGELRAPAKGTAIDGDGSSLASSTGAPAPNGAPTKLLSAPFSMAKIAEEQEAQVHRMMQETFISNVNINKPMGDKGNSGIDYSLSQKEIRDLMKRGKKAVRQERKDLKKQRTFALQRDEIIQKLSNRPVKLHPNGKRSRGITGRRRSGKERIHSLPYFTLGYEDYSGQREIRLQGISMALTNLELLSDVTITFSEGRKYGLIGRNGIGKVCSKRENEFEKC